MGKWAKALRKHFLLKKKRFNVISYQENILKTTKATPRIHHNFQGWKILSIGKNLEDLELSNIACRSALRMTHFRKLVQNTPVYDQNFCS